MLKAVVDTNLFVSGLISKRGAPARLLELWRQQHFILVASFEIIEEIREVLEYPHISRKYDLTKADIRSLLSLIEHEAVVLPSLPAVHIIKEDADDNKFLACAMAAKADYIVSGDRHLLEIGKYRSVSIVTVKEFLLHFS